MTENIKLRKPHFVKIIDIKPGEHGYNTYAKVLSVKVETVNKYNGETLDIAEVQFGDSTAIINARIVGQYASILKEGKVYAIRNGKSTVFNERQRLEIDAFGKITAEDSVKIETIKKEKDLSSILYEKVVKKI